MTATAALGALVLVSVPGPAASVTAYGPSVTTPPSTPAGPGPTAQGSSAGAPSTTAPGQRATVEAEVDVLEASVEDVQARIQEVDARLAEEQRRLDWSRAVLAVSMQKAQEAAARAAEAHEAAEEARRAAKDYAVEAFIRPPVQDSLAVLSLPTAQDAQYGSRVLRTVADERREVLDAMTEAEAKATSEQRDADAAAAIAGEQAEAAEAQVGELENAKAEQVQLASSLDDRLDHALSEAAVLRELDRKAAQEMEARELALRRSAPRTPAPPAQSAPSVASTARPSAGAPAPTRPAAVPATPPPPPPSSGVVTRDQVVSVRGILVHRSIAAQVEALLGSAAAAGHNLSGSGWRDTTRQIQLRMQHCGTTPYAIYEMPADQCSPPVARPGRSMHERGLALDLTVGGDLIRSRSHPAFIWLAANAARFGFYNLPSEPWHWSTTGS